MVDGMLKAAKSLIASRRGNVAVVTAGLALPLIGIMGLSIDYALAVATKAKLDAAADAAAIAAITKAKTVIGGDGTTASAITQGQTQGLAVFKANAGALSFSSVPQPTITITPSGQILTATVSYSTDAQNQFGMLFKVFNTRLSGSASSSTVTTPYYQFVFVVDISGSMSIGGTSADIEGLYSDSYVTAAAGRRCSFACHDPNHFRNPGDPRAIAKTRGYNLKIDYVNQAIQNFISSLKTQTATISGVFSVGIDTFASTFTVLQAPISDLTAAQTAASTIDIEPMAKPDYANDPNLKLTQGYTTTTASLTQALSSLQNIGDGTSPSKQATYVIFLSDGVEDILDPGNKQIYYRGTDITYTSACQAIKNAGATLISIAAPYPSISASEDPDGQYQILVKPFQPPAVPNMATAMSSCATNSTWAFQATDGPGIKSAVNTALQQILQSMTRLTQ